MVLTGLSFGFAATPSRTCTILLAGDVMLARGMERCMQREGEHRVLSSIQPLLARADIAFCNLESPFAPAGTRPYFPTKPYSFFALPSRAGILKDAGFTIVSLANNHTMDCGPVGLSTTTALLDACGILHTGAGNTRAEATAPAVIEKNGVTVAFLAYSVLAPTASAAGIDSPGIAPLVMNRMQQDIRRVKPNVDVLVVSLHWGMEYDHTPLPGQRILARQLIDAGADLIAGHHPHVLQGVEQYRGKLIFYSLGNLVFDQKQGDTGESILALITLEQARVTAVTLYPIDKYRTFLPRPADGATQARIRDRFNSYTHTLAPRKRVPYSWEEK